MALTAPTRNLFLAATWFMLGLIVIAIAITALTKQGAFIAPGTLLFSILLFMQSAQRTKRYSVEPRKFNKRLQWVGLVTAIASGVSLVLHQASTQV
ncbi:hypothetical protein [Shewanella sp. KCT]|uniref:hypothetical protein n=1 Tax=Shewanella sp. KCT TaxID=2569535 RepID=UPI0011828218|nr:hypothetical protein [Shewanella sp. KCT]TVP09401.1 hypothetical protein AYI87_19915 [Shewanella sp. KCT]